MRNYALLLFGWLSASIQAQSLAFQPMPTQSLAFERPRLAPLYVSERYTVPRADSVRRAVRLEEAVVVVKNTEKLNGDKDDFSPYFYKNGLIFCSSSRKSTKNAEPQPEDMNLKYALFDSLGQLSRPVAFGHKTNSKTHEGPSCLTAGGDTLYLTRVMSKRGMVKLTTDGETNLKIYIKTRDSLDNFVGEALLPFESENYSYCHPTLSPDGQQLFFASNMPGGFGGMDLWVSRRLKNGAWSQPINLGPRINTSKNELFPNIGPEGSLFFASNGQKSSKGGLDIYKVKINDRQAKAEALPAPFNSDKDDFGLIFLPDNPLKGFFSSNRPGGKGGDDIYTFDLEPKE